jgi:hypothetical protein
VWRAGDLVGMLSVVWSEPEPNVSVSVAVNAPAARI